MKPGRRDIRHKALIAGDELQELKRDTGSMAKAFGLDRKIEAYQGTRPITLYRWDLECLMDVIEYEQSDKRKYPDNTASDVEFSWDGGDGADGTPLTGRGWAVLQGDELNGLFCIHNGDDSQFVARRMRQPPPKSKKPSR
jgi:hypothetical protein